jgi:hypothetical protein
MVQTQEGERNDKLNALAFKIGRMVKGGKLSESALDTLMEAARESGLPVDEVEKTSQSGFKAGIDSTDSSDHEPLEFYSTDEGIFRHYEDRKPPEFVAPPLEIIALTRDDSSDRWGIWVRWNDFDDKEHNLIVPMSMLAARDMSDWLSLFADGGYIIALPQLFRQYLKSYKTHRRAISVDRTGWHGDAFVFPDTVFYVGTVGAVGDLVSDAFQLSDSNTEVL